MKRFHIATVGLAMLMLAPILQGQIPKKITYQGVLRDAAGDLVADGSINLLIRIYDDKNLSTNLLHEEFFSSTVPNTPATIKNGVFTVVLGTQATGLYTNLDALDSSIPLWLEIGVWDGSTWDFQSPRTELTTVLYASNAAEAEKVSGTENVFGGSGNVGIGTTTPTALLELAGVGGTDGIKFPDGTLQTSAATSGLWSSGAGGVISYSSGNVGIGTAIPSHTLQLLVSDSPADGLEITDLATDKTTANLLNAFRGGILNVMDSLGVRQAAIRGYAVTGGAQASFTAGHVGFGIEYASARIHAIPYDPTGVMIRLENDLVGGRIFDFAVGATGSDINLVPPGGFSIIDVNIGSPRLTIDNNGNVGIGIANPATLLHIGGTPGVDGITFPDGTLQTSASPWALNLGNGDITPIGSGNVGIGTTTPLSLLQLEESAANALQLPLRLRNNDFTDTGGSATGLLFSVGNPKGALVYERKANWGLGSFHFLQSSALDNNAPSLADAVFTITNSGNVGIGTTTPGGRLTIWNDDPAITTLHIDNLGAAKILITDRTQGLDLKNWQINNAGSDLFFGTLNDALSTSSPLVTFTRAGDVGIGVTSPSAKLQVAGTVTATAFVGDGSDLTGLDPSLWSLTGSTISYTAGNVGIGTTVPTSSLEVVGDVEIVGNIIMTGGISGPAITRYYAIPGSEFTPMSSGTVTVDSTNYYLYSTNSYTLNYAIAPVHVPHEATITGWQIDFYDNIAGSNDSTDFVVKLFGVAPGATPSPASTLQSFEGNDPSTQADNTISIIVNNSSFSYFVTAAWKPTSFATGKDLRLYRVLITYTVTSPLP